MTRSIRWMNVLVLAVFAASGIIKTANSADEPTQRRIIVFKPQCPDEQKLQAAQVLGDSIIQSLPLINAVAVEAPADRVAAMSESIQSNPGILRIDPDPKIKWFKTETSVGSLSWPNWRFLAEAFRRAVASTPISRVDKATGAVVPWGVDRVRAPQAWKTTKGEGVKVCVIDTGIDKSHPDLQANVKGGWNVLTKTADFMDDNEHGTHVSGTIAGAGISGGVVGVAPKASLYGVKVLDANGEGNYDDVIAGMQWCVENHMQIASMSLGGPANASLKDAVKAVKNAGVVLIVAAGNDGPSGKVDYPGAYPGAIAVAALQEAKDGQPEQIADFSSRGKEVAVAAPGVDVLSTKPGNSYQLMDGTSMATPHMSGLAALAIAARHISGYRDVRAALLNAARPVDGATKAQEGKGVVDASILVK